MPERLEGAFRCTFEGSTSIKGWCWVSSIERLAIEVSLGALYRLDKPWASAGTCLVGLYIRLSGISATLNGIKTSIAGLQEEQCGHVAGENKKERQQSRV